MMDRTLVKATAHVYAAAYRSHAHLDDPAAARLRAREATEDFIEYVTEDYKHRPKKGSGGK